MVYDITVKSLEEQSVITIRRETKPDEIAKRVDIAATATFHGMTVDAVSDLDLSYTPPLGSPWDAVQMAAQAWVRETRPR